MYQNLAILAAFAFIYSAFAKRIERNWISGPIVWSIVIYSLLSLTLVRMLPILLSLAGTGERLQNKLFLGWFGPRGLASIVFAIIVLNEELRGGMAMAMVVVCTVGMSIIAHGITANPLASAIGKKQSQ